MSKRIKNAQQNKKRKGMIYKSQNKEHITKQRRQRKKERKV